MNNLSLIVAMDKNNLIGVNNSLPWNIKEDLELFKNITSNNIIVMGRKTFESIGRPLPNRINIILTKNKNYSYPGTFCFTSFEEVLSFSEELANKNNQKIFIIGGESIYSLFLPYITEYHISKVFGNFIGDTFFPKINFDLLDVKKTISFDKFNYYHLIKK